MFLATGRAYDFEVLRGIVVQEGRKSLTAMWAKEVSFLVAHTSYSKPGEFVVTRDPATEVSAASQACQSLREDEKWM